MELTNHLSPELGVKLNDRFLWIDGDSSIAAEGITSFLQRGISVDSLYVTELTEEIQQFNRLSDTPIEVKTKLRDPDFSWKIPTEYAELDISEYIMEKLRIECDNQCDDIWEKRAMRIIEELRIYSKLKLLNVLRTIIYVINTLEQNNQVWGVGRGSSVSSYILYLIGVHDVDSIEYGLEITDFLRSK